MQDGENFAWRPIISNTMVMMTSSNGNIFRITGPFCGEFTGHRRIPLTMASDAKLWCFLWSVSNKRLSKQSRRRWFETPTRSLRRHCNDLVHKEKYVVQNLLNSLHGAILMSSNLSKAFWLFRKPVISIWWVPVGNSANSHSHWLTECD